MNLKIAVLSMFLFSLLFSKEVCFTNFNKEVCGEFNLLDRVIVKSPLSKKQIIERLQKPLKQIAFLADANLYLIDSKDSLTYSKELSNKDFIIYAQPDVAQKRIKETKKAQDIVKKYDLQNIWKTTTGKGINIAIIDDGFNLKHEDLKGVHLLFSYDVDTKTLTSDPRSKLDIHGTQVAGVIFARHNGIGIDGIAPDANLIAIRQTTNTTSDTVLAFSVAKEAGADIINCSWNSPVLLEPVYDVIKSVSKEIAVVFAAGNSGKEIKLLSTEASIPEVITVGATQKYSNYGKVVDIKIPSGLETTRRNGSYGMFGGTSSTAPVISGLLALKMAQNRNKPLNELVNDLKKDVNKDVK